MNQVRVVNKYIFGSVPVTAPSKRLGGTLRRVAREAVHRARKLPMTVRAPASAFHAPRSGSILSSKNRRLQQNAMNSRSLPSDGIAARYIMRLSGPLAHRTAETSPIPTASIFHHSILLEDDRQHFANQLLPIAFKADPDGEDPFDDDPTHPIHLSHDTHRCAILDVITSHIENVCAYQHRTAVFSLLVVGRGFRVLRWAHDGLIVTRTIDYVQDTRMLVEFLLGYLCLEDVRKGIDPSASLLPSESEEYKLMDHLARHGGPAGTVCAKVSHQEGTILLSDVPVDSHDATSVRGAASATAAPSGSLVFDHVIHLFSDSLKDNWPRYRLTVDEHTFLVGKPIAQSGSGVIGRGTRGYVAWHEQPGCFVFLKDTWRPSDDHAEAEGDILQKLNDAKVVNVPTLVCHGFVGEQEFLAGRSTLHVDQRTNPERKHEAYADTCANKNKRKAEDTDSERHQDEPPRLRRYTHYRMCVKEICLPLSAFTSSKQLVSVVRDCIEGTLLTWMATAWSDFRLTL